MSETCGVIIIISLTHDSQVIIITSLSNNILGTSPDPDNSNSCVKMMTQ